MSSYAQEQGKLYNQWRARKIHHRISYIADRCKTREGKRRLAKFSAGLAPKGIGKKDIFTKNMLRALEMCLCENTFEDWERYYVHGGKKGA